MVCNFCPVFTDSFYYMLICRYKGPNLLDAIDSFSPPRRDNEKPLLMPICDVVKTRSMAQVSACGKLEAGALRSGCKVCITM